MLTPSHSHTPWSRRHKWAGSGVIDRVRSMLPGLTRSNRRKDDRLLGVPTPAELEDQRQVLDALCGRGGEGTAHIMHTMASSVRQVVETTPSVKPRTFPGVRGDVDIDHADIAPAIRWLRRVVASYEFKGNDPQMIEFLDQQFARIGLSGYFLSHPFSPENPDHREIVYLMICMISKRSLRQPITPRFINSIYNFWLYGTSQEVFFLTAKESLLGALKNDRLSTTQIAQDYSWLLQYRDFSKAWVVEEAMERVWRMLRRSNNDALLQCKLIWSMFVGDDPGLRALARNHLESKVAEFNPRHYRGGFLQDFHTFLQANIR